jgi:hypothetical protein
MTIPKNSSGKGSTCVFLIKGFHVWLFQFFDLTGVIHWLSVFPNCISIENMVNCTDNFTFKLKQTSDMNKKTFTLIIFLYLAFFQMSKTMGIERTKEDSKKNYLSIYFGIFEWNLNYEGNILQFQKSYSNIRCGFGYWGLIEEAGNYLNPSFVHVIGKKNSHLEVDIGVKIFVIKSSNFAKPSNMPDLFLGYRFEKPDGKFLFRAGINYPTVLNLGFGYKF